MSEHDLSSSGSRWEPSAGDAMTPGPATVGPSGNTGEPAGSTAGRAYSVTPPGYAAVPAGQGTLTSDDAQPARSSGRRPRRAALAAAGVGLVLAGGIGGFAIGHAVAGNAGGTGTVSDQNGVPGRDGFGGRPDFGEGRGPDGFRPHRTAPGGTAPGGTGQGDAPPNTGGGTA